MLLSLVAVAVVAGTTNGVTNLTTAMSTRRPTTTRSQYDGDGVTLYYDHTMNETVCYILRSSNVTAAPDVIEIILNVMSRNLQPSTVSSVLKALDGEVSVGRLCSDNYRFQVLRYTLPLAQDWSFELN
ncbi:hypothetical protein OESDEN_18007 [Oesophagostomum dentatum]|uniref:Uncharacterized protein n=1 Tax=Oesophagostomum dentatum TaxID=61180 RepID=A0A0B1SGH4_OESDE|nr:hypothetical protein OESDEN_18007 [Oesophagostomum dentatum]